MSCCRHPGLTIAGQGGGRRGGRGPCPARWSGCLYRRGRACRKEDRPPNRRSDEAGAPAAAAATLNWRFPSFMLAWNIARGDCGAPPRPAAPREMKRKQELRRGTFMLRKDSAAAPALLVAPPLATASRSGRG